MPSSVAPHILFAKDTGSLPSDTPVNAKFTNEIQNLAAITKGSVPSMNYSREALILSWFSAEYKTKSFALHLSAFVLIKIFFKNRSVSWRMRISHLGCFEV